MPQHDEILKFSQFNQLMVQEEKLELKTKGRKLIIGIPRETSLTEYRVPLTPQSASNLVSNGHKVLVETEAGRYANFSDHEYSEAGAIIAQHPSEIFKADIVLKVSPPTIQEIEMMEGRQVLFSVLHLTSQEKEYFTKLMKKKMTCIAYEYIRDNSGVFPILRSTSEIVGSATIFIAAQYLQSHEYGKGKLVGGFPGISPTEIVIIGSGTVAQYAAKAAIGLGASVKVFDNSIYKLRRIQDSLGCSIYTSVIEPDLLQDALIHCDIAIGAVHSEGGVTPCIVSEEMVSRMSKGSVIIDVSIDQGGCFATSEITTHKDPVFMKYGVCHYCVPNIASSIPRTASYAFSNFCSPLIVSIGEEGGTENKLRFDPGLRNGVYIFNGTLTKRHIGHYFDLPFQDIELLMAAYH